MNFQLIQVRLCELKVTSGSITELEVTSSSLTELEPTTLSINDPSTRATLKTGIAQVACLQFRYLGPTSNRVASGSGTEFHQIGLKLRSKDPCNLIYVMWRIQPTQELVIQTKRNVNQSTSEGCHNQGYTTVARIPFQPFLTGQLYEFMAWVQTDPGGNSEVCCWVNWQEVLRAPIDSAFIQDVNGLRGIRSDNGQYNFRFFTAI
jgi:hypothetical protein